LPEVFAYTHAEIASIVGKTEANCRQIARRAGKRLKTRPKAALPPTDKARRVVEQFVKATLTGEISSLLALLETDATLYSDGGGRVAAAAKPIQGADRIGRFFVGIRKRLPAKIELRVANINGQPGVLMFSEGTIFNAVSFELDGDRVRGDLYRIRFTSSRWPATGRSNPKAEFLWPTRMTRVPPSTPQGSWPGNGASRPSSFTTAMA
jgi:RNA polymerase sigma-70 factor (ECF subfamily)